MKENEIFQNRRKQLVEYMLGSGAIEHAQVKYAFLNVQREIFMQKGNEEASYIDSAFPIGEKQTISQPSTIAIMLEMLDVQPGNRILEIGIGSGYVAALLSELVWKDGKIYGVEIIPELKEQAEKNLKEAGCENVEIFLGDGSKGLPDKAPFDRIIVSAACPYFPKPLWDQLAEKGTAVAPIGDAFSQRMTRIRKFKGKMLKDEHLGTMFTFVPLKGEFGFK